MQAGRVKAGEPHVAHDHDAERVFGVFEPVRQLAALVLAADVRLTIGAVIGAAGRVKCECRSANCEVQSVRHLKFVIRHLHHRLHALLEMRHQVGGHHRDAFQIAHQRRGKCECRSAKSEV